MSRDDALLLDVLGAAQDALPTLCLHSKLVINHYGDEVLKG